MSETEPFPIHMARSRKAVAFADLLVELGVSSDLVDELEAEFWSGAAKIIHVRYGWEPSVPSVATLLIIKESLRRREATG